MNSINSLFGETFEIPVWIPEPAKQAAVRFADRYLQNIESDQSTAVFRRLVEDTRMKNVWGKLLSRKRDNHRRTAEFVYALNRLPTVSEVARSSTTPSKVTDDQLFRYKLLHSDNLHRFFYNVILDCVREPGVVTAQEIQVLRSHMDDAAKQLRELGRSVETYISIDHVEALLSAASACEKKAERYATSYRSMTVQRLRGDRIRLGVVFLLSDDTVKFFGRRLDGIVATIANVALGVPAAQSMKAADVRSTVRHRSSA